VPRDVAPYSFDPLAAAPLPDDAGLLVAGAAAAGAVEPSFVGLALTSLFESLEDVLAPPSSFFPDGFVDE